MNQPQPQPQTISQTLPTPTNIYSTGYSSIEINPKQFPSSSLQPEDWTKSHESHHSYKSILNSSIQFTNSLMLLLTHKLNLFDLIESSELGHLTEDQLSIALRAKCDRKLLRELLDFLVANNYLKKEHIEPISESLSPFAYRNSTLGKKLCQKNMNEDQNYSNMLYLMDKSLRKFSIADSNLLMGRQYNITNHIFYSDKDLLTHLSAIEKLYSFSYDNFIKIFDFSKKMSIYLIGGAKGKFAETVKLINPSNDVNIIDDKTVEAIVNKNLKKRKMNTHIFFIPVKMDSADDLIPNADLFIVSYYLHWNNYEKNMRLFRKVADSLNPEGKFALIEFMYDQDEYSKDIITGITERNSKSEEIPINYKSDKISNSIAFMNSGNSILNDFEGYSPKMAELLAIAKTVGFSNSEIIRTEGLATIIIFSK